MKINFYFTALLLVLFQKGMSQSKATDIQTFTLSNGMKILVLEDNSIPNANMYLFWKVGSRNEYPGITGLSHFFEHMMFNGSKKYGPKMFDRTMEAAGGSNNAYTTENLTVYTDWFPISALETIFDLEADRIGHLDLDPKMVESERGVVLSERSTGLENSNFRNISEQVKGAAFLAHPYRWSVIGYESDIKNWSIEDLQTYFDTYYAPNNAVVVISGDVTLKGSTNNLEAGVTGSGDFYGFDLEVNDTDVSVTGSGDAKVVCNVNLKARVTGSGDIVYKGNPKTEDTKVAGSGSIKK